VQQGGSSGPSGSGAKTKAKLPPSHFHCQCLCHDVWWVGKQVMATIFVIPAMDDHCHAIDSSILFDDANMLARPFFPFGTFSPQSH